jgi:hypothetical protein
MRLFRITTGVPHAVTIEPGMTVEITDEMERQFGHALGRLRRYYTLALENVGLGKYRLVRRRGAS